MTRGRHICDTLKDIRRRIAQANDIKYEPRQCHHEGECAGTCPACEAEVRYLEQQLDQRRRTGKKVAVAGIAVGMVGLTAACGVGRIIQPPLAGIPMMPPDYTQTDVSMAADSTNAAQPATDKAEEAPLRVSSDTLQPLKAEEKVMAGVVEEMPSFPGGDQALMDYIKTNLRYPDECVLGRVIVTFTVECDGSISHAQVVKSLSEACDKEALRLVNAMPKWKPGKLLDKVVSTKFTLPVIFKSE